MATASRSAAAAWRASASTTGDSCATCWEGRREGHVRDTLCLKDAPASPLSVSRGSQAWPEPAACWTEGQPCSRPAQQPRRPLQHLAPLPPVGPESARWQHLQSAARGAGAACEPQQHPGCATAACKGHSGLGVSACRGTGGGGGGRPCKHGRGGGSRDAVAAAAMRAAAASEPLLGALCSRHGSSRWGGIRGGHELAAPRPCAPARDSAMRWVQ